MRERDRQTLYELSQHMTSDADKAALLKACAERKPFEQQLFEDQEKICVRCKLLNGLGWS